MIANQVIYELSQFITRWFDYQQQRGLSVLCPADEQRTSPCLYSFGDSQYWKYVPREHPADLQAIASALGCPFHPDIDAFYGYGFGRCMNASFKGLNLSLIQPWNDEDFTHLQENLVAHVLMLKRLKLPVTLFLASLTFSEMRIISLDNQTGEVLVEQLGKKERWVIASNLADFLRQLSPLPGVAFQ